MNIIRDMVKSISDKFYCDEIKIAGDPELEAAFREVKQRIQDFELAEDKFVESAILYLRAAKTKRNELIRERRNGVKCDGYLEID